MEENQTPDTPDPEPTRGTPESGTPEGEGEGHPPPKNKGKKGRKFSSDKPSMSEIIRLKKPNQRSCYILLDSSLAHEINELEREISKLETKARLSNNSLADTSIRELDKLRDELEEKADSAEDFTVEFKFQDIGRKNYDQLVRENPPSDEEKKEYKDAGGEGVLTYSLADFPPRLVASANIEPGISEEEAYEIFDNWSEGDLELLFTTALMACKEPTSLPKSRAGIARTSDSEQNLITALTEESPTPNS